MVASPNLSGVLDGLLGAKVDFILIGGLAAVAQGVPLLTTNVDIVPKRDKDNVLRMVGFFRQHSCIYRAEDGSQIRPSIKDLSSARENLLITDLGPVNVIGRTKEGDEYKDLFPHTLQLPFGHHTLRALNLKVIAMLLRQSKRPKDQQSLRLIEEVFRQAQARRRG